MKNKLISGVFVAVLILTPCLFGMEKDAQNELKTQLNQEIAKLSKLTGKTVENLQQEDITINSTARETAKTIVDLAANLNLEKEDGNYQRVKTLSTLLEAQKQSQQEIQYQIVLFSSALGNDVVDSQEGLKELIRSKYPDEKRTIEVDSEIFSSVLSLLGCRGIEKSLEGQLNRFVEKKTPRTPSSSSSSSSSATRLPADKEAEKKKVMRISQLSCVLNPNRRLAETEDELIKVIDGIPTSSESSRRQVTQDVYDLAQQLIMLDNISANLRKLLQTFYVPLPSPPSRSSMPQTSSSAKAPSSEFLRHESRALLPPPPLIRRFTLVKLGPVEIMVSERAKEQGNYHHKSGYMTMEIDLSNENPEKRTVWIIDVDDNGECGYYALGVSRDDVADELLELVDAEDEDVINSLLEEIRDIGRHLKKIEIKESSVSIIRDFLREGKTEEAIKSFFDGQITDIDEKIEIARKTEPEIKIISNLPNGITAEDADASKSPEEKKRVCKMFIEQFIRPTTVRFHKDNGNERNNWLENGRIMQLISKKLIKQNVRIYNLAGKLLYYCGDGSDRQSIILIHTGDHYMRGVLTDSADKPPFKTVRDSAASAN